MNFPSRQDLIELNSLHIKSTGGYYRGSDNLQNAGSLEWVLDAIRYPLFGVDRYPSVVDKAALLAWIIIRGHVFYDGNKRTGISALMIFLRANGYTIAASDDELVTATLRIVSHDQKAWSLEDLTDWTRSRLRLLGSKTASG